MLNVYMKFNGDRYSIWVSKFTIIKYLWPLDKCSFEIYELWNL